MVAFWNGYHDNEGARERKGESRSHSEEDKERVLTAEMELSELTIRIRRRSCELDGPGISDLIVFWNDYYDNEGVREGEVES